MTSLLAGWREGDAGARDRLVTIVYDELHRLARRTMARERPDHTLQATALVNEAYMQLVRSDVPWEDRGHFYAVAARAMRRILVDWARAKGRQKRGGGYARVTLDDAFVGDPGREPDLVALDAALERLSAQDERKARVVELHYFAGLGYDEVARSLGISPSTVHRDLRLAKAWLYAELH